MKPGECLILAPAHNTAGKKDAIGAFLPEAERFRRYHGLARTDVHVFDNSRPLPERRAEVLRAIQDHGRFSVLAHFGHGHKNGIQAGFTIASLGPLAASLGAAGCQTVLLYSCDTARDLDGSRDDDAAADVGGDGGFADQLRDTLSLYVDCTVYAHVTAGHTTQNPYMRVFRSPAGAGGEWVVKPRSDGWRGWVARLRGQERFDWRLW